MKGFMQKSDHRQSIPQNLDQQLKLARMGEVKFLLVIQESRLLGFLSKNQLTTDVISTTTRDIKRMYGTFLTTKSYKNGTDL
jgi:hypothetical protein